MDESTSAPGKNIATRGRRGEPRFQTAPRSTPNCPASGSTSLLYGIPVSIAARISSYISRITRSVRYSPYWASSLRPTIGKVSMMYATSSRSMP